MASCPKNHLETEIEIESSPVRPASPATAPCTSTAASTSGAADLSRRNSSAASTSGAADPISRNSYGYTVFLNHHGQDVKNTIASHIYHRLRFYGIEVFLDRPELRKGKNFPRQIKDALSNASIYVAIFSPKYAESEWCLNELLWMSQMQTEIIPVFYKIKPHELRQTDVIDGICEQGLQKLNNEMIHDPQTQKEMQRFSPNIMALWRKALSETSKVEGFELDAFNGDEGVFVEKIVEAVLKKIKKISFPVAKHPVGLHVKVKEFEDTILLQQQQQLRAPRVVGIVGLSGVGKTALAKAILNCKRSSYDRSYFFSDISSDFCKYQGDFHIESVDASIEMLKIQLSSNAIIVLDGVDHANQMDAVLPVLSVLGSDNLILITSRNKDVLTGSGVVPEGSIYELTGLNAYYSQQLFCFHAFDHSHPVPGFESLVERFVETCQGLPSSLKLSGELVCRKTDPSYWKDQLDILPQNLARDMRDRLKSSYDGLLRDEKAAFLDTACFFKGERAEMAIRL